MATTTPNFGWSVPTSTDLVKDGATAIELLGDSIDTSLVDLLGGTTGQVLTKASGTDLDFSFTTPSVPASGALVFITAAPVTAATTLTVSNVFSATYLNYVMTYTGLTTAAGANVSLRLAASGTPDTSANYDIGSFRVNYSAGAGNSGGQPLNQTSFDTIITDTSSTNASHGTFNFFAPFASTQTGMSTLNASANQMQVASGIFKATTSFDGLRLTCGQNMTGTFRFYGVANS